MSSPAEILPVMLSKLPPAEAIQPYLQEIDRSGKYCNFGPLEARFRARLGGQLGTEANEIVTFCNGTLALTCALKALNVEPGSLCIIPAWTFTATAAAAMMAGLTPYFLDVDETSWALNPESVEQALATLHNVGCVIPVSPFGDPVDVAAWQQFRQRTGLPVLIDAAGAYDSFREIESFHASDIPVMISLHGTKPLGIGEGGIVISTDTEFAERLKAMTVFGFRGSRNSAVAATNAKISEYTAAVGLAALDVYADYRLRFASLRDYYIEKFATLDVAHRLDKRWISATCNILAPGGAETLEPLFAARNIETRRWWESGCHRHTAYASCPRGKVPVTERLAQTALGIPFYLGMSAAEQDHVCDTLAEGLTPRAASRKVPA